MDNQQKNEIPPDIREHIRLRAIGMALSEFLSSTHKEADYDTLIKAMSDNNQGLLDEMKFSAYYQLEEMKTESLVKHILEAASQYEESLFWAYKESLLWACKQVKQDEPTATAVITLEGGLIQGVDSSVPLNYLVYDHDTEGSDDICKRLSMDEGSKQVEVLNTGICEARLNPVRVSMAIGRPQWKRN